MRYKKAASRGVLLRSYRLRTTVHSSQKQRRHKKMRMGIQVGTLKLHHEYRHRVHWIGKI